jgi:tripartite-type tricarboxylate transporter receptor subunit TctC
MTRDELFARVQETFQSRIIMKFRILLSAALALLLISTGAAVCAADRDYPSRSIRLIMPNAPGSANDTMGRIIAVRLGEALGQQIVVDNRAGAGGVVGTEIGKAANPDGYTLISPSTAATSIAPHLHRKLPYDPVNDFEFISLYALTPNVLVVNTGLPPKTVKEFIEYAKAQDGKLNMASAGSGSQSHLTGAALMLAGGFGSLHVPYKGGGASVASVLAGESQWTITPSSAVLSLVKAGRLRALGHSLPQRSALLPDLQSISETLPGFKWSGWYGLTAPKGTPRPVLGKIHSALVRVVSTQEARDQFAAQGAEVITNNPEEFRNFVRQDIVEAGKVVKAIGLKAE